LSQTASKSPLRDPPVVGCISASRWTVITVAVLLALDLNPRWRRRVQHRPRVRLRIVTADKWEQAATTIGMSITTVADDMLQESGCPTPILIV
jgi:hypothetical protein